ncbi:hypothetical protein H6P81_000142 [Aristolochia fimbriata]|uniref:Uncharacterized protein n=1 Tax=Aristolochia fimbriata TaxID=158543 RepID=A0AAV7F4P6_ARIFI|nr:hypothetical protein H6P81_000142 [Aristolochia fimbriata]
MDRGEEIGNCRPEDVAWLSTLSESEIDLLVSLKKLVIQRANVIDNEKLIENFDLKMLRSLGVVLIEVLKDRLGSKSLLSSSEETSSLLNQLNLVASSPQGVFGATSSREPEKKKRAVNS